MQEKIEAGQIVEGKVVRIKPFGAIVSLPNNSQGLVHISHISTSFVQNIEDHLNVDDTVTVKVLSIAEDTGKIALSIKETMQPQRKPRPEQSGGFSDSRGARHAAPVAHTFEDKLKEWQKVSNEKQAGLNKRNKRR